MFTPFFTIFAIMVTKGKRMFKRVRVAAMLLLMLPALLSLTGAGGALSSLFDGILQLDGDAAVAAFRANISVELTAAFLSLLAFLLLLRYAADRSVRVALVLLAVAELYMAVYWLQSYLSPGERPFVADVLGNSALLLFTILCCYAWSLLLGNARLGADERSWVLFIYISYILSFVAFYAPMWQRFIPETATTALLPESSPVYLLVASLMNIIRCVAVRYFVFSPLFVEQREDGGVVKASLSPLNRYVVAVALAALFIIYGLAFLYRNAEKFVDL